MASQTVQVCRKAFESGRTKCLEFRYQQLKALLRLYEENRNAMIEALKKDLRKSKFESCTTEVNFLINDLKHTIDSFRKWAKPEKPSKGLVNMLDELRIIKEPYGVVLIIGAWNYPLQLTLLPFHGALSAGNCVVLKPSEVAPACAQLISDLVPKYMDRECYQVFCGGVKETTELLEQKFDYIFYTGSTNVGRIIHAAANKHLTPVTLELGGKSPVFLDELEGDYLERATKRILWGKFLNNGQTCVAPDYILCSQKMQDKFVAKAKEVLSQFYGENPKSSPDLCRIVSSNHFKRIQELMNSAKVAFGGETDAEELYIAPTILVDCKNGDAVMQQEIFGPVLPIVTVESAEEAIKFITAREKPLAFYIFTNCQKNSEKLLEQVSSGGVCINDTIMHLCVDTLPFGGVGNSGMGAYHGKYSFDTFVHQKSVLLKDLGFIGEKATEARYPPYSDGHLTFLSKALEYRKGFCLAWVPYLMVFILGFATACLKRYFGL